MLTIDLLKGQGIPVRTRPAPAGLLAIVIAIPVVVTIVTLGNYVRGGIVLRNQKRLLTTIQADIFKLTNSVKFKQDTEQRIETIGKCFVELDDTLPQQIQWSPVLQALAENIPASLVLSSLDIKTEIVTRVVPQRKNPSRQIPVQAPKRMLYIGLYGRRNRGSDEAVLRLLSALNESSVLKDRADNIRLIAQATDKRKNVMNYVIECAFKPY
jgi:Tfp pilus assembly protein PilN